MQAIPYAHQDPKLLPVKDITEEVIRILSRQFAFVSVQNHKSQYGKMMIRKINPTKSTRHVITGKNNNSEN